MVVGETKAMNGVNGSAGGDEEGLEFETTRIEVLKEERSQIQKKTFTKWVNSNLKKKKVSTLSFSTLPFSFLIGREIFPWHGDFLRLSYMICLIYLSLLAQGCPEINDLFNDLKDGKRLMDLLEIIAGKKIGKPNKGVLR